MSQIDPYVPVDSKRDREILPYLATWHNIDQVYPIKQTDNDKLRAVNTELLELREQGGEIERDLEICKATATSLNGTC